MNIVNESVEHISFGHGIITETNDNKIWVQFEEKIGTKIFVYPDAFEKFLKATNPAVQSNAMEDWKIKKAQIDQESERIENEREAEKLEVKKARLELKKKKAVISRKK